MLNLSPVARRRFERFKQNRRGWWSLWLLSACFLTLGASDRQRQPLVLSYRTSVFPVFKRYTERSSAGNCHSRPTTAVTTCSNDQENGAGCCSRRYPSATTPQLRLTALPHPPSHGELAGTETITDVLARVIFGRGSILFARLTRSAPSSHAAGALQGYYVAGSTCSPALLEVGRGCRSVPADISRGLSSQLLVAAGIMALFSCGPGGCGARRVPARRNLEYVKAARPWAGHAKIIRRHILPNAIRHPEYLPFI